MQEIWKERIYNEGLSALELPHGTTVLSVVFKDGHVSLFLSVDPALRTVRFKFYVVCTGTEIPYSWEFVATVQVSDTKFVHVFRVFS